MPDHNIEPKLSHFFIQRPALKCKNPALERYTGNDFELPVTAKLAADCGLRVIQNRLDLNGNLLDEEHSYE
jgi:hypothetical protein